MPPIKLYTNSPINAARAEGITPKTAAPSYDEGDDSETQQPRVQNQIHEPLHPTPTRTTEVNNQNPPPPRPGAVPVPYPQPTQTATVTAPGYHAPPAPATTQPAVLPGRSHAGAGGGSQNTYPTPTHPPPPPPQMGMSLMESTAPHTYRGTSTATAPTETTGAAAPPTSSGSRQVGYGTAGSYAGVGGGNMGYSPPAGPSGYQQRTDFNASNSYQDDGDEEGVWNSAVKWAQAAGEKLSAAESEVWRRINKE